METKDLKKVAFDIEEVLEESEKAEIDGIWELMIRNSNEFYRLLREALDRQLFPSDVMEYYKRLLKDNDLDDSKRVSKMASSWERVKDPAIKRKFQRLTNEFGAAHRRHREILSRIEHANHFVLYNKWTYKNEARPVEAVECILSLIHI